MTPEERANNLRKNLALLACEEELIALYIRTAENEALERAVEKVKFEWPFYDVDHLTDVIRALKHKEPS